MRRPHRAIFERVRARTGIPINVLEPTLDLAIEIAREGREGRRIGTIFVLGNADAVLARSRPLILDPLAGHVGPATHVTNPDLRGTLKELAQLDGAFVIDDSGTVVAACRYLNAPIEEVEVPLGLGSRHLAAAAISRVVQALSIVVSESAVVRAFHGGELIAEIIPELYLLSRHDTQLRGRVTEAHAPDFTILTTR